MSSMVVGFILIGIGAVIIATGILGAIFNFRRIFNGKNFDITGVFSGHVKFMVVYVVGILTLFVGIAIEVFLLIEKALR